MNSPEINVKRTNGVYSSRTGAEYIKAPDGSLRRVGGAKKMSKKQRRKMRGEAFAND